MKYIATVDGQEYAIEIIDDRHVRLNDKVLEVDFTDVSGQPIYSLLADGKSYEAYVRFDEGEWEILMSGHQYRVTVEDEREKRLRMAGGGAAAEKGPFRLKAPMPGLVVAVKVSVGQAVQKGDVLLILESMKMQNELKAPRDGVVSDVRVQDGETVEQKQTLLKIE